MDRRPMKKTDFFNKGARRLSSDAGYDEFLGEASGLSDPNEPLLEAPGYGEDTRYDRRDGDSRYYPEATEDYRASHDPYSPQGPMDYSLRPEYSETQEYQEQAYADYGDIGYSQAEAGPSTSSDMPGPSEPHAGGENTGNRRKDKRAQTCRLCANHNLIVEKKGHKPFCKFQIPHNCSLCEITLRMRDASAAQQKMTRNQQPSVQVPPQRVAQIGPREFPRMRELEEETKDIIDLNLFSNINDIVRSRSNQPPQ